MTQAPFMPPVTLLSLVAPVDGLIVPLEELPDAVFAEKMLGDGLSIDPTGTVVLAPCAGVITQVHRARHAMTLRTEHGISVLIHVGLDTVRLNGRGFKTLAHEGQTVTLGQPLIEFDLDVIAQGATSALVEIVVTEGGGHFAFKRDSGLVTAGSDEIVRVSSAPAPRSGTQSRPVASSLGQFPASSEGGSSPRQVAKILNPHGMHARPAARLAKEAKSFSAEVFLTAGEITVSATSVTDIMSLDLIHGAEVEVSASGPDADAAVEAVRMAIAEGLGEKLEAPAHLPSTERHVSQGEGEIGGVAASPGLAVGTARLPLLATPDFPEKGASLLTEKGALTRGISRARADLEKEEHAWKSAGEAEKAQIFAAHQELLDDKGILTDAEKSLQKGASAARSWQDAMATRIEMLGSLKSPLLRQRATDMKDVAQRVLYAILELPRPTLVTQEGTVLVCDDLTPSTVASLNAAHITAIVTQAGGATSHAAIIARSMGVPYVAAVGPSYEKLKDGQTLIVNGSTGSILIDPSATQVEDAQREMKRLAANQAKEQDRAHERAQTKDGRFVEVAANIGNAKDALQAAEKGCDGVGLLRSEFLFLGRRDAPTEEEQKNEYVQIAKTLGPEKSLVVRTLDVGGDKPLAYIPLAEEENPFLGIRGLRVSFKYPEVFRAQLRATLAAAAYTKLNIMFPMVASRDEFLRARDMTEREMRALGITEGVAIGVMVEVPSAALNARWLAKEADFFSIGTNDLTQYTLAMDRGHSELAALADAFDPSVLRLIQMTADAAHSEGKWVGVCGGLAAEPLASPLLIGLDIDELSVPAPVVPELKQRIRTLSHAECRAIAEGALAQPSARAVRQLLTSYLGS